MSDLANLQWDFCQYILGHGQENFLRHVKSTDLSKEAVLDIYHNNIFSSHMRSLAANYPLVFSIIGTDAAKQLARAYIETSLPCTGALEDWGGGLASFIQRFEEVAAWPYLAEVAQLEWAKHIAYCSQEDELLTSDDMKQLIEPNRKEIKFHFQKSCQLLAFLHPIDQILKAQEQAYVNDMDKITGSCFALIVKHEGIIHVQWLSASLFVFINRLKEGHDSEVAFAAAQVLDPKFDVQNAFCFLLQQPILHR